MACVSLTALLRKLVPLKTIGTMTTEAKERMLKCGTTTLQENHGNLMMPNLTWLPALHHQYGEEDLPAASLTWRG